MECVGVPINCCSIRELKVGKKVFRSAFDFRLSEGDLRKSHDELNEIEEVRNVSLQKLKKALCNDSDFKYRQDDAYLLRYLRFRKFNVEEAHRSLRKLYVTREKYPDLFHIPPNLKSMLSHNIVNVLPYTDEQGLVMFFLKFGNWNPDEMNFRDIMQMGTFISDVISLNPHIQINGCVGIWDIAEPTIKRMSHVMRDIHPTLWLSILQEMYPWRIKRMILFNCNLILYSFFRTFRWLLKPKIAERIVLLQTDLNELHQFVNPALLPKEYGGTLEDKECYSFLNNIVLGNLPYLQYEHSFRTKTN